MYLNNLLFHTNPQALRIFNSFNQPNMCSLDCVSFNCSNPSCLNKIFNKSPKINDSDPPIIANTPIQSPQHVKFLMIVQLVLINSPLMIQNNPPPLPILRQNQCPQIFRPFRFQTLPLPPQTLTLPLLQTTLPKSIPCSTSPHLMFLLPFHHMKFNVVAFICFYKFLMFFLNLFIPTCYVK